jgi:hypothetical protein
MASLRDRQIREVLDEDLRAYREVVKREIKQAKIMNETYAPPNRFEKQVAFQIDQYFLKLQRHADDIVNNLVNGNYKERGVKDLLYSYQELIAYLDAYTARSPINQRDKAIIENKFDAIANQVEQISSFADNIGWRSKFLLAELSDILDFKTYLPIENLPFTKGIVSKEFKERGFNDPVVGLREPVTPSRRDYNDDDEPPAYDFAPEAEFGSLEDAEEDISQMASSSVIPKPRNLTEAKDYMKSLSMKDVRKFAKDLDMLDDLKAKKSKAGLRQKLTLNDIIRIYMLKEQGIKTTKNRQPIVEDPEALLDEEEVEAEDEEQVLEEEEEAPAQGQGMSGGMSRGFGMCGSGESEDMMYGLPQGYKKAMRLRPMDRTPVRFKTQDERGENGLSLEDRMEFLNQLDSRPIKDDIKVNSTGTYKKSMSEKAKKIAKYYS